VNVNDRSWPVNLIEFDTSRAVGRSSYHVQKLFAVNRPDEVLKTAVEQPTGVLQVFALAGLDHGAGEVILKTVNRAAKPQKVKVRMTGLGKIGSTAKITTLSHQDPTAENTLDDPDVVVPVTSELANVGSEFTLNLAPHSLVIARFKAAPAR
jgi:alpha-N-arabinofuranosidase